MGWVERLFAERSTVLRLALVTLAGVGYLTVAADGRAMSTVDRTVAVLSLALVFLSVRWPLATVAALAVVSGAGWFAGAHDDTVPTVGTAWALFELAARRRGRQVPLGLALGLAGSLVSDLDELVTGPANVVFAGLAVTGAPVLIGLYARALADLNGQAAARAAAELDRVRADERTAIARELHDLVAHHVASIVLRVGVARTVLPLGDPRVRQVLDDVHATGSGALADLRRLVAVLREPGTAPTAALVEPAALPVALDAAVDRGRQVGLTVEAGIDPDVTRLDARTALAVLRLTQEGLANAARHAGPGALAALTIRLSGDRLAFDLRSRGGGGAGRESGAGRDGAGAGGVGLAGLRERVEVLGGELSAGPEGDGWRLSAWVPAKETT
ncbi:histidine kinase [Dactylosporangium sp. NPDC000244]|uniref:sensor histidine kinase n=1 Tax=Dactylosporangium sp. NPDC000244 TaxID=3154365 RepID=UPI00331ADD4F